MKENIYKNIKKNDIGNVSLKIGGWNSDLGIAEAKFSYCEFGKLFAYTRYYTLEGVEIIDESLISQYKNWEKEKWAEFAQIANKEGILAGMTRTCVR